MDEFKGVSAKVEITMERVRNRGLDLQTVRRLIQSFRERGDYFKSLSIKGAIRQAEAQDVPMRPATIDFIRSGSFIARK
jgi:hypothetical protein